MTFKKDKIFTGVRGKIGDVVYSSWKGIPVIRKAPGPRKKPPTDLQLQNEARFRLLVHFFKPLKDLLNEAFENILKNMSPFNMVISLNKGIIAGKYPDFRIDFSLVTLCQDYCLADRSPVISCIGRGLLRYYWEDGRVCNKRRMPEICFVAAYCEELKSWIYTLYPERQTKWLCDLDLTPFCGYTVQTYIGFKQFIRRPWSCYTGSAEIIQ
jgi:hypothetical protein